MFSIDIKQGIFKVSKKRYGFFVENSSFLGIEKHDEIIEINDKKAHLLDEAAFNSELSKFNICSLLILPHDKKKLIQTCLNANNIFVEKSRLTAVTKIMQCNENFYQVFILKNIY